MPSQFQHHYAYALRQVFLSFWQQKFATFFFVLVLGIVFCLPTVSFVLWKNVHHLQQTYPLKGEMSLFLKENLSAKQQNELLDQIRDEKNIAQATYISPKESLQTLKGFGLEETKKWFDDSQLPPIVMISLHQLPEKKELDELSTRLQALKGVDIVLFEQDYWQKIREIRKILTKIGAYCTLLMLSAVFLIINHSIRAEVYWQKKQIEVMQLLGATQSFILRPFLFKGILYILAGAVCGLGFTSALLHTFSSNIATLSELFQQNFIIQQLTVTEMAIILLLAILLGYFCSTVATLRYMQQLEK